MRAGPNGSLRRLLWFVGLWALSVAGFAVAVYAFRALAALAFR